MAKLDDPLLRERVVTAVTTMTTLQAAAHCGVSATAIGNYRSKNEDFRMALDAARARRSTVAHHAPRMLPSPDTHPVGATGGISTIGDPHERARRLITKCEELLDDEDAPPAVRAKALHVLAEYDLGPLVHAGRLRAQREAAQLEQAGDKSTRPVVIRSGAPRVPVVIDV